VTERMSLHNTKQTAAVHWAALSVFLSAKISTLKSVPSYRKKKPLNGKNEIWLPFCNYLSA